MIKTDACIVGAGPGGVATALKLNALNIPSVLIDRATFPRDKVCGDAISGKVTTLLNRLDPAVLQRFNEQAIQMGVWGIKFVAPNLKELCIPFKPGQAQPAGSAPGYVSRRLDFDNFLVEEARRCEHIRFFEGLAVEGYERSSQGWKVKADGGQCVAQARMLFVADGAHSSFSRKEAGLKMDHRHHAAAVRAYFEGIEGFQPQHFIELHFIPAIRPGYLWVFPLPGGQANVGIGMRTDFLKKRKANLRRTLFDTLEQHPVLRRRFRNARLLGEVKGYGLPLGSKRRSISGDNYMLIGDAAHLVDPLTGEGIGNAFYSGFIAAEQLQQCLAHNDFSGSFLKAYDQRVSRVLGSEMRLSYRLQKMLAYPHLANILANIIAGNQKVVDVLSGMYNDFHLREQLARPAFWLKMLFRR